jgi:hypothetical protein
VRSADCSLTSLTSFDVAKLQTSPDISSWGEGEKYFTYVQPARRGKGGIPLMLRGHFSCCSRNITFILSGILLTYDLL